MLEGRTPKVNRFSSSQRLPPSSVDAEFRSNASPVSYGLLGRPSGSRLPHPKSVHWGCQDSVPSCPGPDVGQEPEDSRERCYELRTTSLFPRNEHMQRLQTRGALSASNIQLATCQWLSLNFTHLKKPTNGNSNSTAVQLLNTYRKNP